ncbi:MAG: serine hydrolase [Gammaproteobacteria bacterium]|nr:serine hydrolase [Gammaproteobacteria bacterium]MYF68030.1 serine hydrolase [Gammaproteobacteria bacterium]MYK37688.1 serine hydrolase [Gammaproteobacteria bacterium]
MRKKVLGLLGLLLAAVAAAGIYDWAFWYNYLRFIGGGPPDFLGALDRYPTTEPVPGDLTQALPGATGEERRFAEAIAYAREMQSDSLLVWHDGALRVEWYREGLGPDIRPETASMHKSILGLMFGLAIEKGHIGSVDDPVSLYLPEWRGEPRGGITIRNLLNMASGFMFYTPSRNPYADFNQLLFGMRLERLMLELQLASPPGARFAYANVNSQLLGVILERATGRRYADFVSENLWQPLGADDAYVWLDRPGGLARTYAAFLARPRDWLRLGLMIKDGGRYDGRRIVSGHWIDEMTAASGREPNYGYQIWLSNEDVRKRYYTEEREGVGFAISEPFLSDDLVYFDGIGGQRVFISADDDYVIVRTGPRRVDWDEAVLPNAVARALVAASIQLAPLLETGNDPE